MPTTMQGTWQIQIKQLDANMKTIEENGEEEDIVPPLGEIKEFQSDEDEETPNSS